MAEVIEWGAVGETSLGHTSRPQFYRPSIPGIANASAETALVSRLDSPGVPVSPASAVASIFATSPSLPVAPKSATNLPFVANSRFPRGRGLQLLPGQAGVLYASTDFNNKSAIVQQTILSTSIQTWTGYIVWEEL